MPAYDLQVAVNRNALRRVLVGGAYNVTGVIRVTRSPGPDVMMTAGRHSSDPTSCRWDCRDWQAKSWNE